MSPEPCRRCAALLYGSVKFCPYCGAEASAVSGPGEAPREDVAAELAHIVPASLGWPEELHGAPDPDARRTRSAIGRGAALLALLLALVLGYLYFNRQGEADRSREFAMKLEQVQSALSRGDLNAAERALVALVATHPNEPGVQALKAQLDQRVREQLAKREQLLEATQKAARSLGLGDPAPAPAAPPVQPPPAEPPAVAAPAPANGIAAPPKVGCDPTLAALALCER
jgi:hypothetical protein